ncbi:hypothetical protein PIB30_071075 [Stylosanthes scabra]|uniref:Uncharacterized protein n=1 Tax=Stylosanthes scabra TaxID=79078 RepID=A0ABU6UN67_9FABA|nr:hypothetical protein [Stylosanthes scabra]
MTSLECPPNNASISQRQIQRPETNTRVVVRRSWTSDLKIAANVKALEEEGERVKTTKNEEINKEEIVSHQPPTTLLDIDDGVATHSKAKTTLLQVLKLKKWSLCGRNR